MRCLVICIIISFLHPGTSQAGTLEAVVKNNVFYAPATGTYVESDILVIGNSIAYVKTDSAKYHGAVDVVILFKQNEKIARYDKYTLYTVDIADTARIGVGIVDKKRYSLPKGNYSVDITFTDVNSKKVKHIEQALVVDIDTAKTQVSDISLVDYYARIKDNNATLSNGTSINKDYVKSGFYMTPVVLNFYPDNVNKVIFYAEAYVNQHASDTMLAVYSIRKAGKDEPMDNLSFFRKIPASPVVPLFGEFDITHLVSGNYNLVVELKDRKGIVVTKKELFFQRSKTEMDAEELARIKAEGTFVSNLDIKSMKYQLRTIRPVSTADESNKIRMLLKSDNLEAMQDFYLQFWLSRNQKDPKAAQAAYQEQVQQVNQKFGTTVNFGFETERGRIYLQYGPPNQLTDVPNEPGAYPYQIWMYYNLPKQSSVKFVFYNPDFVTNEYELIHSTALNEIRNDQWQKLIYGGTGTVNPNEYGTQVQDHYGSKATERFNNP